jgi:hypothetical protein
MSAFSPALAREFPRAVTREAAAPMPKPERLAWVYGRLRYVEEPDVQWPTRWKQAFLRLWHGRLHQPRVSDESRPVLPDFRGSYGSRREAWAYCRSPMDFIVAIPYGAEPLGDEIGQLPTFCRPLHRDYRRKDAEDSARYTADLCSQLAEEHDGRMRELADRLERLAGDG